MRVIAIKNLHKFWEKHPDSEQVLKAWDEKVRKALWTSRQDIEKDFGHQVKFIKGNRVRFKIKNNDYRLIVAIDYNRGWIFIKFIGTHAEYDKIDAETINNFKIT